MTATPSTETTITAPPPPGERPATRRGLGPAGIVLVVVASLIVASAIGAAAYFALWRTPVELDYSVAGSSRVAVDVPDARFTFSPSDDGDVHVTVSGWHSGPTPEFTVATEGDVTSIDGGCTLLWLQQCSLRIDVAMPGGADLTMRGVNGDIAASALSGTVRIATTNGSLSLTQVSGELDVHTVNGTVRVQDASGDWVNAGTTNGAIDLHFTDAPAVVTAQTVNGAIAVRVPDGDPYTLDASTVNGRIDTHDVALDSTGVHTLTLETVNGSVTVEHSD